MIKQKLKSSVRKGVSALYFASHHLMRHLRGKVIILTYHRVVSSKELDKYYIQPGMYVKSDTFEMQMKFLKDHFVTLPFAELLHVWRQGEMDGKKRYCVITFDDGWLDNYVYAYPILKKYSLPATIFLTTSYIGTSQWFWPDKMSFLLQSYCGNNMPVNPHGHIKDLVKRYSWLNIDRKKIRSNAVGTVIENAIKKCKELSENDINNIIVGLSESLQALPPDDRLLLDWKEVKEMSNHGISFGSHTSSHRILTKLSSTELQKELSESRSMLGKMKINHIPVFCYPNGNYTDTIVEQVKASGYQAAVSTDQGFEGSSALNQFTLKRIGIHDDISKTLPLFAYRLSGVGAH